MNGNSTSPQFDFGGTKPRDYKYTGMQAAGDVAGQLLRVGKPFAEATGIRRNIESHEREMATKERIRSFGVATRQMGGIMARAKSNNAHIFEEINRTPEAQEFIGGKLKVTDTGETRDGNKLYSFNVLNPKTGQSINEIHGTTAEAVNMFDGMLAPEVQRGVRETARTMDKARKRIKDTLEKYSTKEGNIIDLVAEGINLSPMQQQVLDNIFLHGSKSQKEIMAQLISDKTDEIELKKERATAEEARAVSGEERAAAKSATDIALAKARTEEIQSKDKKPMTADEAREKLFAIAKFKSSLNKTGGWNETIFELMAQKDPEFAKRALSINSSKKEVNDTIKELEDYYRDFLPKEEKGEEVDIERQNAQDAIDQGVPLENVQRMYKLRTGEELEL